MKSLDPWDVILVDPSGDVVWPRAAYGHPFYREVPSWIHYGQGNGTHRLLFDGAFVAGDVPSVDRTRALEAPMTTPTTPGSITVKKEFDDKQVLHVEICVDGQCYKTSMDLAPAIKMVMAKLAQWHQGMHGNGQVSPATVVVGAIENAIDAAGDTMVTMLVGQHAAVMASGLLDDIGGALSSAGSAIGGTLRQFAPVISTAAAAVATAYGGPAAGAAAKELAPTITNLQANLLDPKGDPAKKAQAQQALQRVRQVAQADPRAVQALNAAHQAVRDTTVAYHIKNTVDKAVAGDQAARNDVDAVVQAGQQGDPSAKSSYEMIAQALLDKAQHSQWGAQLWDKITGGGSSVSGWYDMVGATYVGGFWDDVGNAVLTVTGTKATNQFIHDHHLEGVVGLAGQAIATYYGGPAGGAAAKALGPTIMSLGVEDKAKASAAQRDIHGVTTMAQQHSPEMAQAVDVAHGSIKGAATAYHIDHLLKRAKGGDARAQRALAKLRQLAAEGNFEAQQAVQAVDAIHQAQAQAQPPVSGWYDIVGAVIGARGAGVPYGHHRGRGGRIYSN